MKQKLFTGLIAFISIACLYLFIIFPKEVLDASVEGLTIWGKIIFPSLLPFFILSELLISFGVVRFIGVLAEPIMRPLFNVSGAGSFAWIIGMASGYPAGAKITAKLRQDGQLTRVEAERLIAYSNNASPLFIFGAVAVGMLHDAKVGILLAVCHYGSNVIVGFLMRFYQINTNERPNKRKKVSLRRAFSIMHQIRMNESRPFGTLLSDAVIQSMQTLFMVGGFIILFSVLANIILLLHVTSFLLAGLAVLLSLFAIPVDFAFPIFTGLFELSLGTFHLSNIEGTSLLLQLIFINFILGFNGFSVQAQVAAIIAKTDIRFSPYFYGRIIHGIIASILTIILYIPLYGGVDKGTVNGVLPTAGSIETGFFAGIYQFFLAHGMLFTALALILYIFLYFLKKKSSPNW